MKFSSGACVAFAGSAFAYPALDVEGHFAGIEKRDPPGFPWQGIPAGGVRAPCPGLNTMANHGYINRNGIGITPAAMQQGFLNAFNMGLEATQGGANSAIGLCSSLTGRTCTSFNLDQLNTPHAIEHDASLSRRDKEMFHDTNANNHEFNQTIWDRTLMIYGSTPRIGLKFANTARTVRVQQAQEADFPGWFRENQGGSLAEHAFTLSTMNDPSLGINLATPGANPQARMDWINYWFTQQRLPTALGWQRPSNTITLNIINSLEAAVLNAGTVTADVGQSPFLRKRWLDTLAAEPQPSYNFDIKKREDYFEDLEKRAPPVPLAAVPSLAANPKYASKIYHAQAQASVLAGPPPAQVNPYNTPVSADQWSAQFAQNNAYQQTVQSYFEGVLGDLGVPASS